MRLLPLILVPFAAIILTTACNQPPSAPNSTPEPTPEYRWLPASDAQKFLAIEEQLQGFSRSMREIHYRYNELYFAAQDQNWPYADYQLEHLVESLEQGMARRPERATHSTNFIKNDVPPLQEAIDQKNPELFAERFQAFTTACNTCHAMEDHPFIHINPPTVRFSAVGRSSE